MVCGKAGNTKIDQFAADLRLDTSILRNSMLRDGHIRLNLEPADDRGLQAFGWRLDLVKHAVDAVTDAESFGQRLEMNIRGPHFESLDDERIDQLDEWGVGLDGTAIIS